VPLPRGSVMGTYFSSYTLLFSEKLSRPTFPFVFFLTVSISLSSSIGRLSSRVEATRNKSTQCNAMLRNAVLHKIDVNRANRERYVHNRVSAAHVRIIIVCISHVYCRTFSSSRIHSSLNTFRPAKKILTAP